MSEEEKLVVTEEIFGHKTDFEFRTQWDGKQITFTVSAVFPALKYDSQRGVLISYAPPRYPWD